MPNLILNAEPRTTTGSRAARRMRREGFVPGVVYGKGNEATSFTVSERDMRRLLREGARSHLIDVTVGDNTTVPTLLKAIQSDPVRGDLWHIDLQQVDLLQMIDSPVAIHLVGDAPGVKEGGVLDQTLREIVVRALPNDLPESIDLDISELQINDTVTIADLPAPDGVEILGDPEASIASITMPRALVEKTDAEEGEGVAEDAGADSAAGESSDDSGDE